MFEIVKTDVFTRSVFLREASGSRFYNDFELNFGVALAAKFAHVVPFGRPVANTGIFFESRFAS